MTVKISVSLADGDVAILDRYMKTAGVTSRSAAIQRAVRLLGDPGLSDDYASAWEEWVATDDATLWEAATNDGLPGA
ncbi:MAG: ribbon-helix-helix domain-containing protein [Arachnia sp.]